MKNDSLKAFSIMKRIKAVTNQRGGGGEMNLNQKLVIVESNKRKSKATQGENS